jgi:hypothetical protein
MTGPVRASQVEIDTDSAQSFQQQLKRQKDRETRQRKERDRIRKEAMRAAGDREQQEIRNEQKRLKQAFLERQAARA